MHVLNSGLSCLALHIYRKQNSIWTFCARVVKYANCSGLLIKSSLRFACVYVRVQLFIIPIVGVIYDCFAARSTADINTRVNYHPNNPTAAHVGREAYGPLFCLPDAVRRTCTIIELTHLSTSISARRSLLRL